MSQKLKFSILAIAFALVAFFLTPVIWPFSSSTSDMMQPNLMPFFIFLSLIENLAFGCGIALILTNLSKLKKLKGKEKRLTTATFISITWILVSWWPHDNLHRTLAHDDMVGLLRIEYGFHLTLIISGAIIAYYIYKQLHHHQS